MRFPSLVSVASAIALASLASADVAESSDVLVLTKDTFTSAVNSEPLILVEFYAPWCGHCKALAPHYEEAATTLKGKDIKLAKVDCVDQADLCQSHGVQGYPTLKVFRNGEPTEYSGPRKADGIISYMLKQNLPAVSDVTASNLAEFQNADKLVVLAYVSSTTKAPAPEFSATAEKLRDEYLFGITSDAAAIAAAGVTPPAIVVYRNFDERITEYPHPPSAVTTAELEAWIQQLAIPILGEVNGETYAMYAGSGKPIGYLFLDPTDEKKDETLAVLKPVAAKYRGKIHFVWIDATKFGDHAKALNLAEPKWPSFVIQNLEDQLKYPYDQSKPIEAEAVSAMVGEYLAGKLLPKLKSQPIPESQNESVFTLVNAQFDEVVYDDSKDVFVEFYATWCGHCKRLKPIWDSLGDHFADVKDQLVIAKMESQENDLPASAPFRISGFPTLKFKPAGSREFLEYNGDRELESLVAYVQEHAKNSLKPSVKAPENESQATFEAPREAHDEL
ncbi:thioredoxin-like protein [Suillus fuscotomentosus]|uniref:Protein disulfide-isomerase n=1 Tax=Suillus fuscotomentosus TaxID=1912939 RepID=A0AAD4HSI1_9AGAM|nr:thioredoxin-like protein [Suillus fuscotomentosus]KAG1907137.1 thioredoxin-like protein [Suillus fuscotomentosus]